MEHEPLEEKLRELLRKYEVSPELLTLEITETALVINPMKARRTIDALVQLGIHFSIDDFGAGYTSFKYLKTFRISEIKIDQEFVTGIEKESFDACLVQSIAHFCRGLGVRLIVEGVETQSDLDILVELGCETGQGYHMARPMPIEDLKLWLGKNSLKR